MIDYYAPKLDLTLLGCGFLGTYHLGAIHLLGQVWPQKPYNRICGASCGGLLGALLLAGLRLELVLANAVGILKQLRGALLSGQPANIGELVERNLEKLLPPNAHQLCSDRLGISLTKLGWSMENRFLSNFRSRRELIDAIRAGCFIPLWSGSLIGPKLDGCHFVDGAYSDNSPRFPPQSDHDDDDDDDDSSSPNHQPTITLDLNPFASHVKVSPRNERCLFEARVFGNIYLANWQNVVRTWHAMLPFHLTRYKPYLLGGHHDMKDYLIRNDLIKCRKCYLSDTRLRASQTSARDNENAHEAKSLEQTTKGACLACLLLLERVDSLKMPQELVNMLNE